MKFLARKRHKKERVVLTEVLPFEIPIVFSNREFYLFLVENEVEVRIKDKKMLWKSGADDTTLEDVLKLLFGLRAPVLSGNKYSAEFKNLDTIPFKYQITHKENDFRELVLMHPRDQVILVDFYSQYRHLMLYYSSLSSFSIRKPVKVARPIFNNDLTGKKDHVKSEVEDRVEIFGKEYQSLKTYFVYKSYSNIHKFYESYKFHRCEKKYKSLFKFDISKCFDSIYTHSLSWALLNKDIVKDNLHKSKKTFGGWFDSVMRSLNYNETNGIIIGPEVSRIFAELILQRVDLNVEVSLMSNSGSRLLNKRDYEIFRYVDDYFIFYNEESTIDRILTEFRMQLKVFKLYLNEKKTLRYEKPIITEITIAKQRINDLFDELFSIAELNQDSNEGSINELTSRVREFYIDSNKLITKFKIIVKESGTDYKDIINYALALVERKLSKLLLRHSRVRFEKSLIELLDFTFFLYSVAPRVNTTIRLCRILRRITDHCFKNEMDQYHMHSIFKRIKDNIQFVLHKNRATKYSQVETLYLLIALRELGNRYWLDRDVLCEYVGIDVAENKLTAKGVLNYFVIVVLLFYISQKKRYSDVREFIQNHVKYRMEGLGDKREKSSEITLLLFDLLACPYLNENYKKELLSICGIDDIARQRNIIKYRKQWFTNWSNFDLGRELDLKQSKEAY